MGFDELSMGALGMAGSPAMAVHRSRQRAHSGTGARAIHLRRLTLSLSKGARRSCGPLGLGLVLLAGLASGARALDVTDREAVIAAYNAQSGWDAAPEDLCIVTNPGFPDVAVVGTFAHDRGCAVELVLVGDAWLPATAAASPALLAQGWQASDPDTRAALAMDWVDFAVFPFHGIVYQPGEEFSGDGAPAFEPPSAVADESGGVVVTAWVQEPPGMLPEALFKLWELTFDAGAKQVRTRVLADWRVPY